MLSTTRLATALKDKTLLKATGLIAGQWLGRSTKGKTFDVKDPASGELLATLPDMTAEETRTAIAGAKEAFPSWAAVPPKVKGIHLGSSLEEEEEEEDD